MDRPRRNIKRINYKLVNEGKMASQDDFVTDEIDIDGENELCGKLQDFNCDTEDEMEVEEGELLSEDDTDWDALIQECVEKEDLLGLKAILHQKEENCKKLQERMKREKKKNKEMQEVLEKLKKVKRTEDQLNRSLANSRSNTPSSSPKRNRVKSAIKKPAEGRARKTQPDEKERSEYESMLLKLAALKGGNLHEFSKQTNKVEKQKGGKVSADKALELTGILLDKHDNSNSNKVGHTGISTNTSHNTSKLNSILKIARDCNDVIDNPTAERNLLKLLNTLKLEKAEATKHETSKQEEDPDSDEEKKKKKKKSGKLTKVDESDIVKPVHYPHEKLDPRHSKVADRVFDKLPFNLLVAGELELAVRPGVSQLEMKRRVQIARAICYHQPYLQEEELRYCYDQVIKEVERGRKTWEDDLGEDLHRLLDFRVNAIMREKWQKVEKPGKIDKKIVEKQEGEIKNTEGDFRPTYCMDYNLGTCVHTDNHSGKFGKKKVIKWHICKRCFQFGEYKNHTEKECTRKA